MHTPTAAHALVASAINAVEGVGIDVTKVCRTFDLVDPRDHQGDRVPIILVSRLLDAIAEYTANPEFIYSVVPTIKPENIGTVFYIAKFCQTVFDALRMICRYSSIASEVIRFSILDRKNHVDLIAAPNLDVYISAHQIEGILYGLHYQYSHVQKLGWFNTNSQSILCEVYFSHDARFAKERYEKYFGCPVHFGCEFTGARLNPDIICLPLGEADERMEAYFRTVAERNEVDMSAGDSLTRRVQRIYVTRMAFGEPNRQDIAKALSLSVRTLQRQLSAEGKTYRSVVEQARFIVAKQELKTSGLALNDIAFLLGYSDERAFRRAFQRWTGITPAEFRTQA